MAADKYRSFFNDQGVVWRHGGPPTYDAANQLSDQGRTKEWSKGLKRWFKTRIQDFKTINPQKFKLIVKATD